MIVEEKTISASDDARQDGRWPLNASPFGRRSLLRGGALALAGLSAAALLGCSSDDGGSDDGDAPAATSETTQGTGEAMIGRLVQDPNEPYPYDFPDPANAKRGGTFIWGTHLTNSIADPRIGATGGSLLMFQGVYDRLLAFKTGPEFDSTKLEIIPMLAESWETSPNGSTYTFRLRDGVKWQNVAPLNGRAFEAEDVKFAYEQLRATSSVQASEFVAVDSIQVVDPRTLKLTAKAPVADFLIPLANRTTPIFPHELVDNNTIAQSVVGTGPLILKELVDQQSVKFDRNPDYWRDMYLDGVEARIIVDPAARVAAFRVEQLDFATSITPTFDDVDSLLRTNPEVVVHLMRPANSSMNFGMFAPEFDDERVRWALSLAMDRDLIINLAFGGRGFALGTMPWTLAFEEIPTGAQLGRWMRHDLTEAKRLLTAAGAEDLKFENTYYSYFPSVDQHTEIFQQNLRDIGVTMESRRLDNNAFTAALSQRTIPVSSTSVWGPYSPSADNYTYGHMHSKSPSNRYGINDPMLDEMVDKQRFELDPIRRRALLKAIYDYDLEKMYRISFPSGHSTQVYQPWIHGLRMGGALNHTSSTGDYAFQVHHMWVDK